MRHVLRNALVPIVTMTGLQFGYLLGGAVVVEQIFSIPGIGRQVLLGIQQKEYAVVQSTVLVIALAFVIVNLLTDCSTESSTRGCGPHERPRTGPSLARSAAVRRTGGAPCCAPRAG